MSLDSKTKNKVDMRRKTFEKKMMIPKLFFSVLFAALFIVLTKTKISPILGTDSKISVSTMFGPILGSVLGIKLGLGTIIFAQCVGVLIGLYKLKSLQNLLVFVPIMSSSLFFSRSFKGDKRLVILPLLCIIAFLLHPIGREVWYYSLFWIIPIGIVKFNKKISKLLKRPIFKIYAYSLGTTFVDHAIGSVIYLWLLNIPAKFWIAAIPLTLIERLIIAAGIDFSYHAVKYSMKIMQDAMIAIAKQVANAQSEEKMHDILVSSK